MESYPGQIRSHGRATCGNPSALIHSPSPMAEIAVFLERSDGIEFIGSTAIDGLCATTIHSLRATMHGNLDKPLPKFEFLGSTGKPIDDEQVGVARDPASVGRQREN